jgi:endoglucanase
MHKLGKKITGSLMAAAMVASATTAVLAPMSAFAGDQLGQSTFDEGIGLPWHTCETNPAKQTFDITGGTYNVHVVTNKGPEGRWDLQLRHRGLHIEKDHQYEVSWEITSDTDGFIYSKIGNYKGDVEIWHDLGAGEWQPIRLTAGQTAKGTSTFTANQTLDVAEWAFHYADNQGAYGNSDTGVPDGATIKFDNLTLIDKTNNDWDFDKTNEFGVIRPKSNVRINQVGYYQGINKKASYVTDASTPLDFEIRDAKTGAAVYTGKTVVKGADPDSGTGADTTVQLGTESVSKKKDSGANVHIIDFSEFQTPGRYKIFVKDTVGVSGTTSGLKEGAYDTKVSGDQIIWHNWVTDIDYVMNESTEFRIDNSIYDGVLRDSVNYYYQNRSGMPVEAAYITSGDASTLAHDAGHVSDKAYVQPKWVKSYSSEFDGDKTYSIEGKGGWYDAGDHGKYVVNGGISVWTLQNMYEFAKKNGNEAKFADGGTIVIPENSNGAPNILDEARYELEWMFKMMVSSSDPAWGKYEGMVYHKLHDHKWTGLATKAWDYEKEWGTTRIVKPPTYAATYNLAAVAAQASRLWAGIDDSFANECLANAEKAFEAANKNLKPYTNAEKDNDKSLYAPMDQAIGGGAYGDTYVDDDQYWAACELYATTGDSKYYDILSKYSNPNDNTGNDKAFSITTNLGGGENNGSFSSFNWGCTSGLGTLSLYLNSDKVKDKAADIKTSIKNAADAYVAEMANQGMGIPYHGAKFTDPVNIGVDKATGKPIEITGYEWGSNSFVVNNAMVMAYAYDSTADRTYIDGAAEALDYVYGRNGLGFSYISGYTSDSELGTTLTYPHHRYWAHGVDPLFPLAPAGVLSGGPGAGMQDPYIGGLGYTRGTLANQKCYVDNAEAWSVNEVTINWNAPLAWMTSFMEDEAPNVGEKKQEEDGDILWGDANVDKEVNLADAVLILQSLANPDQYKLSAQGAKNADVVDNGSGVTAIDATPIQLIEAGKMKQTDLPIKNADLDNFTK